jgi:hypothetical protein
VKDLALSHRLLQAVRRTFEGAYGGVVVTVAACLVLFFMYGTSPHSHSPGSDGHYMWLFARSVVYDHDIDFKNDYELCGDPQKWGVTPATGRTNNPLYIGPALVWTPILWILHHIDRLPRDAPTDVVEGCHGGPVGQTLWAGPVLGALTVWLLYRIARRWTSDGSAALTAGLLAMGTPLAAYAALKPSYSHIYDSFWTALTMLASLRAAERPQSIGRWGLVGAMLGITFLQRPVSIVYGVVPAALAIEALRTRWRVLARSLIALGLPAFVTGLLPQMMVNHYLFGVFLKGAPAGPYYMQYGHAHPWLLLFGVHGGFFLTAPVAWLAVPGAVAGLRAPKTRTLVVALLVASAATIWISSAAMDWDGSGTFGARRLTSLAGLLATPVAITLDRIRAWLRAKPDRAFWALGVAALVPITATISGAGYGQTLGKLPTDEGVSEAELYGTGDRMLWNVIEQHVGAISILPGELWFRARYGLPGSSFGPASEVVFQRSHNLDWVCASFDFNAKHRAITTGLDVQPRGMSMSAKRATAVFASRWPYATGLYVRGLADRPVRVRVGHGRAFGRTDWYGEIALDSEEITRRVDIPDGKYDSGINEFVFEREDDSVPVTLVSMRIEDTHSYPGVP